MQPRLGAAQLLCRAAVGEAKECPPCPTIPDPTNCRPSLQSQSSRPNRVSRAKPRARHRRRVPTSTSPRRVRRRPTLRPPRFRRSRDGQPPAPARNAARDAARRAGRSPAPARRAPPPAAARSGYAIAACSGEGRSGARRGTDFSASVSRGTIAPACAGAQISARAVPRSRSLRNRRARRRNNAPAPRRRGSGTAAR